MTYMYVCMYVFVNACICISFRGRVGGRDILKVKHIYYITTVNNSVHNSLNIHYIPPYKVVTG